jgi:hypothetical protein
MAVFLGFAVATTLLLLPLSIYPGILCELAFFALISSPFWLPATGLAWWVFADLAHEVPELAMPGKGRRSRLIAAVLLVTVNCGLLWCGLPRRLGFLHARSAFEACLAAAPAAYASAGKLDWRLGIYHVDRCATDPRGGVYFRTRAGPGGFSSRKVSYGFVHRPNRAGSPFGDEQYALAPIAGDWYSFQASEP